MAAYNKIGFLLSSTGGAKTTIGTGANKRNFGIGDYVRALDAAGIPAAVACNDGNGGIADALALIRNGSTVPHVLGYRIVSPDDNPVEYYSVPDYMLDPAVAARRHFDRLEPVIQKKRDLPLNRKHLWWFPINEVRAKRAINEATGEKEPQFNDMAAWDWMGEFCYEFALIANQHEYRVSLPMANSGEPRIAELDPVEIDAWKQPGMKKFLKLCAARPQQVCVGLHEYSWEVSDAHGGIKAGYPTKVGRFQYLFRACDEMEIPRPHLIFGEWGWKHDTIPAPEVAIRHIHEIAELYAQHPQILGAFIWYLGRYNNSARINDETVRLLDPVTRKTLEWRFPDPEPNGPLDLPVREPPKEKPEAGETETEIRVTKPDSDEKPEPADGGAREPVEEDGRETPTPARRGVVNAFIVGLNMRATPDTRQGNANLIVRLDHGTEMEILAEVPDLDDTRERPWYHVAVGDLTGYVAAAYVTIP
jgi:hypothetical protein